MFTQITLMGRVTADLEIQTSAGGTDYIQFNVAVNKGYGEQEHANFYQCVLFGKATERISKAGVKKGSLLFITGDLDLVEFTPSRTTPKARLQRSRYMTGTMSRQGNARTTMPILAAAHLQTQMTVLWTWKTVARMDCRSTDAFGTAGGTRGIAPGKQIPGCDSSFFILRRERTEKTK